MKKTVLVAGGAGFIGSNFIYYLFNQRPDYRVVCVDCMTYAANADALADFKSNTDFVFYKENICNRDGIFNIFKNEKPDYVINFAAESHVDRSIQTPELFLKTNVLGTSVLLDACNTFGVERYHQIGTDEVYGEVRDSNIYCDESMPMNTSSPYSASKGAGDLLTLSYYKTYGLPVTISRCCNNYGPYQYPEKLIPLMIKKALNNELLPVYGTGENIRNWIHVNDHCEGILAVLEKGKSGEIYNLGSNVEKKNIEIVKIILDELDKPESLISYVEDRKGHDIRYAIDSSKAKRELGWIARTDFEYGLTDTIHWYKELYDR